jgi:L-fuculose-phosphate aldolase
MSVAAGGIDDTIGLRQEIIAACLRLRDLGYFIGTWGNIGVRVRQGLLVTPTRLDYAQMQADDLVLVDWEGRRIRGNRLPSSEMELHRQVLALRGDLAAIVHTHSPFATAVAAAGRCLPVFVEDLAQIIGGEVRCSHYVPGGRHRELAAAACAALGQQSSAALLANHGAVCGGRDLAEAVVAVEVLEKAAHTFILAQALGGVREIPKSLVAEERERFLHKYGTPADQAG